MHIRGDYNLDKQLKKQFISLNLMPTMTVSTQGNVYKSSQMTAGKLSKFKILQTASLNNYNISCGGYFLCLVNIITALIVKVFNSAST